MALAKPTMFRLCSMTAEGGHGDQLQHLPVVEASRGNGLPVTPQTMAEHTAGASAEIAVIEEHSDPKQGGHEAPKLLRAIGGVPAEMLEALAT